MSDSLDLNEFMDELRILLLEFLALADQYPPGLKIGSAFFDRATFFLADYDLL